MDPVIQALHKTTPFVLLLRKPLGVHYLNKKMKTEKRMVFTFKGGGLWRETFERCWHPFSHWFRIFLSLLSPTSRKFSLALPLKWYPNEMLFDTLTYKTHTKWRLTPQRAPIGSLIMSSWKTSPSPEAHFTRRPPLVSAGVRNPWTVPPIPGGGLLCHSISFTSCLVNKRVEEKKSTWEFSSSCFFCLDS